MINSIISPFFFFISPIAPCGSLYSRKNLQKKILLINRIKTSSHYGR